MIVWMTTKGEIRIGHPVSGAEKVTGGAQVAGECSKKTFRRDSSMVRNREGSSQKDGRERRCGCEPRFVGRG
jgi:hypothetical protein